MDDKYGKKLMKELNIPKENKRDYSITDAANYYSVNIKLVEFSAKVAPGSAYTGAFFAAGGDNMLYKMIKILCGFLLPAARNASVTYLNVS